MTDTSATRRDGRHARRDVTRYRLQKAAVDLFLEQGFAQTTTVQVAARAHVSERTLFRIFATKAGLLWHDPFVSRLLSELETSTRVDLPVDRHLAGAVIRAVHGIPEEQWLLDVRRRSVALSEPELIASGTQALAEAGARLEAALQRGRVSGAAGPQPTPIALFSWFTLVGFTRVPLSASMSREEWADALLRVIDLAAHGALRARTER